jgi:hypothetical protein
MTTSIIKPNHKDIIIAVIHFFFVKIYWIPKKTPNKQTLDVFLNMLLIIVPTKAHKNIDAKAIRHTL